MSWPFVRSTCSRTCPPIARACARDLRAAGCSSIGRRAVGVAGATWRRAVTPRRAGGTTSVRRPAALPGGSSPRQREQLFLRVRSTCCASAATMGDPELSPARRLFRELLGGQRRALQAAEAPPPTGLGHAD